jgi:arylformamidase
MPIHDVTRPVRAGMAVWPGDPPVTSWRVTDLARGELATTHGLSLGLHAGTHLDAPAHVLHRGAAVDAVPLAVCCGPAWLVDVGDTELIRLEHLLSHLPGAVERLIIRTRGSRRDDGAFPADWPALDPAAADHLAAAGLLLLGVDTPSVDPVESHALPAHHALLGRGVVILENLALADVPAGPYELIALPLRLTGLEASPVRAILRSDR